MSEIYLADRECKVSASEALQEIDKQYLGWGWNTEQTTLDLVDYAQALERQLAEAREEVEMLKDIKERMFEMLNLAYCNHDGFKPLFESLCKMIKEQLKEQG